MSKDIIIIEGFIVASTLPSPALLEMNFKEVFKNTRVGTKIVHTVNGWFLNKIKRLSGKYYTDILKRNAIKLTSVGGGLYVLPISKANGFMKDLEKLKEEYKIYEDQLRDFLEKGIIPSNINSGAHFDVEYLQLLQDYLKSQGVTENVFKAPKITERVKVDLIPLKISPELFEEYVEQRAKDYKEEKLNEVAEDVKRTGEIMIYDIKQEFENKINKLQKMLEEALKKKVTKRRIKSLKKSFEEIKDSANDIGLIETHNARFDAMGDIISALDLDDLEKAGKIDISTVEGRTKAMLELAPIIEKHQSPPI